MKRFKLVMLSVAMLAVAITNIPGETYAEDLEGLLQDVGEAYAEGYIAPFVEGFGTNLNSGLYSTASIPVSRLTFSFGIKAMATSIHEDDKTFRRVLADVDFADYLDDTDPNYLMNGTIVMSGPTVFGSDETDGRLTAVLNGVPVSEISTIPGLVDLDYTPTAVPEISIGGIASLRATVRYLPSVKINDDYGETSFLGYGLQYSSDGILPLLPVSIMAGFFKQKLEVGDIVETNATSMFVAVSKSAGIATIYGGMAKESSDMTVTYTYLGEDEVEGTADDVPILIEMDGSQGSRFTLGGSLDLGMKLNAEIGVGKLATYSAGVMFGF